MLWVEGKFKSFISDLNNFEISLKSLCSSSIKLVSMNCKVGTWERIKPKMTISLNQPVVSMLTNCVPVGLGRATIEPTFDLV